MRKRISAKQKNTLLLSALSLILIGLILVYVFLVLPLLDEDNPQTEPPEIRDGEGLYLNTMVTIYPEISESDITFIEVNNDKGNYTFHKYYDSSFEKKEMRIKGYEKIDFDKTIYSTLLAYTRLPVSYLSNEKANAPLRDLSKADMEKYGLTEDTCTSWYKIGYKDEKGVERVYKVFIGNPTFTDYTTYYVALEGRNTAYRFHNEGVVSALFVSLESYLEPFIYKKFSTALEAMASIEKFKIGVTYPDKLGTDDYIKDLIVIASRGLNSDGTQQQYQLAFNSLGTGRNLLVEVNPDKLTTVFTNLYCSFKGEEVMCINPDFETIKKYGLDENSSNFFITAQLSSDPEDTYSFHISREIDGYYYTMSNIYGTDNQILVKVSKDKLSFLTTEDEKLLDWADTNVTTLFYEYLLRNDEDKQNGINTITIRIQRKVGDKIDYNTVETFRIVPDGLGYITAYAESSGMVFETSYVNRETINQFSNYYQLLIFFPKPSRFNSLTQAEVDSIKSDDSAIVFELVARDNNNNLQKFTYYQINNGVNAMVEESHGKIVDGKEVWEKGVICFDVPLTQINILRENFQKLLRGENINHEDYTH